MNTYPLDEPHLAALREACAMTHNDRGCFLVAVGATVGPLRLAVEHVHRPHLAASLVRDLLARTGVTVERWGSAWPADETGCADARAFGDGVRLWIGGGLEEDTMRREIAMPDVPRLISALCNLAPGDKEGAMRALREVGR